MAAGFTERRMLAGDVPNPGGHGHQPQR